MNLDLDYATLSGKCTTFAKKYSKYLLTGLVVTSLANSVFLYYLYMAPRASLSVVLESVF